MTTLARSRRGPCALAAAAGLSFGFLGRSALAEPERGLARAEHHLGVLAFDEAAAELELFALDVPRDPRVAGALERAASLRLALGQKERAARDEATLWRLNRVSSDAARPQTTEPTAAAARTTVKLARAACSTRDFAFARTVLDRRIAEIDRLGTAEVRAEAHGVLALAAEELGDEHGAAVENARVLSIAKANEGNARVPWNAGARNAVADARLAIAWKKGAIAEGISLVPYAGPNEPTAIRAYVTRVVVPWLERKTNAIEGAERAYARVLGIEIPPPPPPSSEGGDPNAPIALWAVDPVASDDARLSARGIVEASERVGTLWATLHRELGSVPLVRGMWDGEGYEGAYGRAKRWYETCAVVWQMHREGDASVCRTWLERNARAEYHALNELAPKLGHSGVVRRLPPMRIGPK